MSASEFIILRVHPDHPKVLRLAALTGEDKWQACGRAVAWFRYVDQNFAGESTGLFRQAFNDIIGSRGKRGKLDYFDAMQDQHINWITADGAGQVEVVEYGQNFGKSSKRRAMNARLQSEKRQRYVTNSSAIRQQNGTRIEHLQQQRQQQKQKDREREPSLPDEKLSDQDWQRVQAAFKGRMGYEPVSGDLTALYRMVEAVAADPIVIAGEPHNPAESVIAAIHVCPVEKSNPVSYIRGIINNCRGRGILPTEENHGSNSRNANPSRIAGKPGKYAGRAKTVGARKPKGGSAV